MNESEEDALAYMAHPKELWPMLASNNGSERLNREIESRADVVQIFPTEGSVVRLVGAILMEQHEVAGREEAGQRQGAHRKGNQGRCAAGPESGRVA